jgi:ATP-dependent Clp endopeptidase proteolytic subunit ClpP
MAEILIYGIVGDSWDGLDANTIVPLISESEGDLDVRINSPGGFVMEGLAIFNALSRAQQDGRKVTTYVDGLAASMASVIAMVGAERVIADNALMMIHNPWDVAMGDAAELRRAADKLDLIRDQLVKIYSQKTGISADDLKTMLDAETWFTAEQALEQKFVTSISEALTAAAVDVSSFGFRKAPETPHLVLSPAAVIQSIITGGATAGISSAVAAILKPKEREATAPAPQSKETIMDLYTTRAALVAAIAKFQKDGGTQDEIDKIAKSAVALNAQDALPATGALATPQAPAPATTTEPAAITTADVQAAADRAVAAEHERITGIRAMVKKHGLGEDFADTLVNDRACSLTSAREKVLDKLADRQESEQIGFNGPIVVGQDARQKWLQGAANWIMVRSGTAGVVARAAKARGETLVIEPGEFRGVSMVDLAREALTMAGVRVQSRNPRDIVGAAFTVRNAITQGTGDFSILLENTLHKILQSSYAVTPDTWSRFCGKGTVTDFRDHNRYLKGTFGVLDNVNELGEFKQKPIPDGAKEKIKATTKGNIISLSRQAIVNDDLGAFSDIATDLGRAAKLTIEVDVYAFINANPNTQDGNAFFSAAHGNLKTPGAAPTVSEVDAVRQLMGSQKDLSGNEFLEIRPSIFLGPLSLGGQARVTNGSQFDPETANKLQRMNIALGIFDDIVDTPRLTGTAWYAFADPMIAPAIEVAFLDGVEEPFLDSEEGWKVDGTEWKVRLDYGVGGMNYRAAAKDVGA